MVKNLMAVAVLVMVSSFSHAGVIEPQKTEQSVNDVVGMKSYASGGIRIFLVDQQEPAARPYKVVVSVPTGGEEFTEYSSFEVGSFCSVDLENATVKKVATSPWATRVISIPIARYNPETGTCKLKDTLTLKVRLMDDSESSIEASTAK